MPKDGIQKQNVGNAGEYYIAARLSALNFTATLTPGRAEKYDILALGPKGKLVKISVKATQNEKAKGFPMSQKDEVGASDDFYYAFVKLNGFLNEPDFWIIPSKVVCQVIRESHERWRQTRGRSNRPHKDSPMRKLPIVVSEGQKKLYPPNWDGEVKPYFKNLERLI